MLLSLILSAYLNCGRDLNYKPSDTISCLEVAIDDRLVRHMLTTQKLLGGAHQCKLLTSEQRQHRQSHVRST